VKPVLYLFVALFTVSAIAQTEPSDENLTRAEIELNNGLFYKGLILSLKKDTINFKIEQSKELIRFALNDIKKINYIDSDTAHIENDSVLAVVNTVPGKVRKKRSHWIDNFPTISYLFVPSAIALKKGSAYYANRYFVLNTFHVGLTERVSINAGGYFRPSRFFFLGARYAIVQKYRFSFSAGFNYMHPQGDVIQTVGGDNVNNIGLAYVAITRGDKNSNFTFGIGYFMLGSFNPLPPSVLLGGTTRISNHIALTGESWILFAGYRIPTGKGVSGNTTTFPFIFSYAIRLIYNKSNVDIGFMNNQTFSLLTPIGIPYLGFTRRIF
jgi:hypothetical protein